MRSARVSTANNTLPEAENDNRQTDQTEKNGRARQQNLTCPVRSLRAECLAVGMQQDRRHETQRAVPLSHNVRLHCVESPQARTKKQNIDSEKSKASSKFPMRLGCLTAQQKNSPLLKAQAPKCVRQGGKEVVTTRSPPPHSTYRHHRSSSELARNHHHSSPSAQPCRQ